MHNNTESSHINHVGVAILVFLLGAMVGYYVGAAYEAENQNASQYDQSYFFGLKKKTVTAPAKTTTTTTTTKTPTTTTTP